MRAKRNVAVILAVASGIAIAGGLPAVLAKNGLTGNAEQGQTLREHGVIDGEKSTSGIGGIALASLKSSALALPQIGAAALPEAEATGAARDLASADVLRDNGDLAGATRAYIELAEAVPDTPQAEAVGSRLDYLFDRQSEAGLDAMEAGLPSPENLSGDSAQKLVAGFYFERASRLMDSNSARARDYLSRAMDVSWDILQDHLEDPFKSELVEKYLVAADRTGQGEGARTQLSKYASGLAPCFTSWLIKTVVDGDEPSMDYVPSFEGKVAVRKHFFRSAKATGDPAEAAESYRKAREAARQLLLDQPADQPELYLASMYLRAGEYLGDRDSVASELEALLAEESLSIMRWIIRGELAMDSVEAGRSEAETRAGFAHFKVFILESNTEVISEAINDPAMDEEVRGIVVCMLGHAYLGTNRTEEAKPYYEWVVANYPREAHACDSAEYSLVELGARDGNRAPEAIAGDLASFASRNPSGAYSQGAFMRAAEVYEAAADLDAARSIYERVTQDYPTSSVARTAEASLERLRVE